MKYDIRSVEDKIRAITGDEVREKNRFRLFLVALLMLLLIGGFFTAVFTGIGAFAEILSNTPKVSDLNTVKPSANKSIVYAADGSVMQELIMSGSNRISVAYEEMPRELIYAFIAIEDARFFSHNGVDVKGVIRAIARGTASGSFNEGASTITQQLIKNNIFDGGMENNFGDRIERKFQEQFLALRVEQELPKTTILEYYLNTINLGSNSLGVQVAANRYFGKNVWELDLSECTVLAAITSNPSRYNPITHPDNNQRRRLIILSYMLRNGNISQAQYDEAVSEDVYKRVATAQAEYTGQHPFSYFTDTVFEDVLQALQDELGYTDTQAYKLLYSGGLSIHTTMDPVIQAIVDEEVNNPENYTDGTRDFTSWSLEYRLGVRASGGDEYYYDEQDLKAFYTAQQDRAPYSLIYDTEEDLHAAVDGFREHLLALYDGDVINESISATLQPQASVVVMDQATGYVKAITGGRGQKTASLTLNRASESTRQPGSTFKVLSTYAPAVDIYGATLASTEYDSEYIVGNRPVRNWWGDQYMGYANIREGIMSSMNVLAVKFLENLVTEDTAYDYVRDFGITTVIRQDKSPVFTLGGLTYGVTNLELTAAYAAIANNGTRMEPVFWTKVTTSDGTVLLENRSSQSAVIKASTAKLMTSAMESSVNTSGYFIPFPIYNVTASSRECAIENMAVAGKSGTTTNANDLWFVGYTPYLTCGIWSGYDSSVSFGESPGYHKSIWQKIMSRVAEEKQQRPASFDYSGLVKATICSKSGLLAVSGVCDQCSDANCHVYQEYFTPETLPADYCNRHAVYYVCRTSGSLSNSYCPGSVVQRVVYLSVDPKDQDGIFTDDQKHTAPEGLTGSTCSIHTQKVEEPPVVTPTEEEGPAASASETEVHPQPQDTE